MFSYWRDKRNGLCHMSLAGTAWSSLYYERITDAEYDDWVHAGRKPFEHPVDIEATPDEIKRAAYKAMDDSQ